MDLKLAKKLALVTGSTAGIGNAIATSLSREGARVIVSGRTPAAVDAVVAAMKADTQGDVIGFAGDLSEAAVAEKLVMQQKRNWGRIIFISSESGYHIPAEMIHYGMTKSAQIAVARGLAETTAGSGVTVNSVLPGDRAADLAAAALRDTRGGRGHGDLCGESTVLGDQRRGA